MKIQDFILSPYMLTPDEALSTVIADNHQGIYASSDLLFKHAIFGRDSLVVAEELMATNRTLAKDVLLTLGSLQGLKTSKLTEEEPGKILHEYRTEDVQEQSSRIILETLRAKWGIEGPRLIYYGSIDATPLFIRVLSKYCDLYGSDILQEAVKRLDGSTQTMHQVLKSAVLWLNRRLDTSGHGLLAYKRTNPQALLNQAWKDSDEFYLHADGSQANHNRPIVSIEVQGVAYDALLAGGKYLPELSQHCDSQAKRVQAQVLDLLWMPEKQYFALGLDETPQGKLRQLSILTANPASLLNSRLFDDLPLTQKKPYLTAIVEQIFSYNFLTDAGIRSRGLCHASLVPFWDYHGSMTTWPKETNDIAKGLHHQGFFQLATQLENRLLNIVRRSGCYPEFVYVDERGRALTNLQGEHKRESFMVVDSTNKPERVQAWTVSAVISILNHQDHDCSAHVTAHVWQRELEQKIIRKIGHIEVATQAKSLDEHYPEYPYSLVTNNSLYSSDFISDKVAAHSVV